MAPLTDLKRNVVREYLDAYRTYVTTIKHTEALYCGKGLVNKRFIRAIKDSVDELYNLLPKDVKDYGLVPTIG